jgi:hypothetical protein
MCRSDQGFRLESPILTPLMHQFRPHPQAVIRWSYHAPWKQGEQVDIIANPQQVLLDRL